MSRNDQWIDRPLLRERPPSGRLVSGTHGQADVGDHTGACGGLPPQTGVRSSPTRRPPVRTPPRDPRGVAFAAGQPDAAAPPRQQRLLYCHAPGVR